MPTCCDETSEAETAAATRGGGKKKRARCTRNYSDDNATLRMHPKRTDEASEFQKPLLTEIHCGESRVPVSSSLFFFCNILPIPLVTPSYCTPCHLRRAFFKVEVHLHVCMLRANILHARRSDEMDTSGRRYTGKWYAVFIPVPLNWNRYLSVRPTYLQKNIQQRNMEVRQWNESNMHNGTNVTIFL